VITAERLTKRYGATLALDDLNLVVPAGSVFGLLGPNGSGKTTFIKLLMGFIFPDAGRLERGNLAPHRIGYLAERPALAPRSRLGEYLRTVGQLSGLAGRQLDSAVEQRLWQVGLDALVGAHVGACSKGMLQRLALAVALLADPPLVVLDEPMEGLDPAWQVAVRDLMLELRSQGKTVLLSTHRLNDVAQVCTHVAILRQGRLRRAGALADVLPLRQEVTIAVAALDSNLAATLSACHPEITVTGTCIGLRGEAVRLKPVILRRLLNANADILGLTQQRATLEEVYLEAMRT
jgi:ABC-2 type transport system ATP-binding protein